MEKVKCDGKTIYLTSKQAKTAMSNIKKYSHRSVIPKRVYHCKECNGYHLTSMKNKLDIEE